MTTTDPAPLDLDAIAVLAAQHHMELLPTGTEHWLKHRIKERCAELEQVRAELAERYVERDALHAALAQAVAATDAEAATR